jgi:nucleoside-diphosphate-sugar epimerase
VARRRADHRNILVTGGTGFVGQQLVRRLVYEGHQVCVLARKLARVDTIVGAGADVCWGDVADLASFEQAALGRDVVIHLAAGTSGTEIDCLRGTLEGTRNLLDLCRRRVIKKLVYISSCSVYGIAQLAKNSVISEETPLEPYPDRRGAYSASKQEAESLVREYMATGDVPVAVLRPGTIYGPGGDLYTPMLGFSVGHHYVVIGNGKLVPPFVFVDNVVDAIVRCVEKDEANGEIFNVVDVEKLSKRDYINRVIRRVDPRARVFYMPYSVVYAATWAQEIACALLGRRPFLTRYRLVSSQKPITYDAGKLVRRLGWQPPVSAAEGLATLVALNAAHYPVPTS